MRKEKKKVIVIGAGLAGLASALRLAKMGFRVSVYEKNERPGGKMNEYRCGSFRFDTGPSVLTMSFVIDDLFRFLGTRLEEHLKFIPLQTVCRYNFSDSSSLEVNQNQQKMINTLQKFSPQDLDAYQNYMKYTQTLYDLAGKLFLSTPIHEWRTLLSRQYLPLLSRITRLDANTTMHKRNRLFFRDRRLIQLFDRYATYNGSDPYQAPATLNMIAYVENIMGACYISGGMYRLVEAMVQLCEQLGIEIHLSTAVEQIIHKAGKLQGVEVAGKQINTDYLICNHDVIRTYQQLIDGFSKRRSKLERLEPSLSGLVFLWNINRQFSQLKHHNIFFSHDYREEFDFLFRKKQAPPDPTIYIAITSKVDSDHAAADGENWFVLLNMPYLTPSQDWAQIAASMKQTIISKLAEHEIDIVGNISGEQILTPLTFYNRFGSNQGSIYGLSSNNRFSAFMRPANRNRDISGLYFVGGSTHPGGGIPLVLRSADIVAAMIAKREGLLSKYNEINHDSRTT